MVTKCLVSYAFIILCIYKHHVEKRSTGTEVRITQKQEYKGEIPTEKMKRSPDERHKLKEHAEI